MSKIATSTGSKIAKTGRFGRYAGKASSLLRKPAMALRLLEKGASKVKAYDNVFEFVDDMWVKFRAVIRMVFAAVRGQYKGISKKNIILSLAAIIYFVTLWDIIPDILPIIGILDDATLVAWLLNTINDELSAFREWEHAEALQEPETILQIEE